MADFNKAGLLLMHEDRLLLCRKNHFTSKLILPGGRIEAGESAEQCLEREIREELGKDVALGELEYVGTYLDQAAADDPTVHKTVEIRLFKCDVTGSPVASSEIVELVWFGLDSDVGELSPILINKILPDVIDRGLLNWNH